jgi:hypothetical protein
VTGPVEQELALVVSAHLSAGTEIRSRVHPAENRAVVTLGGHRITDVALFADRPDLERLRDALTAVLTDLDDQRATLARPAHAAEPAA